MLIHFRVYVLLIWQRKCYMDRVKWTVPHLEIDGDLVDKRSLSFAMCLVAFVKERRNRIGRMDDFHPSFVLKKN